MVDYILSMDLMKLMGLRNTHEEGRAGRMDHQRLDKYIAGCPALHRMTSDIEE